jgi:hypothetical protein
MLSEHQEVSSSRRSEITGKGDNTQQSAVIEAMAKDVNVGNPAAGATFLINLGDIIYGPGKRICCR